MADHKRKADMAWGTLARLMAYAVDRGIIARNPCLNGGRLYESNRQECVWSEDNLGRLYAASSPEVIAVVVSALWTGQRLSDCLDAKWSDLDLGKIKVKQSKSGARLMVPIGAALAAVISSIRRTDGVDKILTNSRGQPWTVDGFQSSYGKAFLRAGIVDDLHFHDLRGTAVTRMAIAGCSALQIAAVTGHSPKTVDQMLRDHYLGGQVELAEQALKMLEMRTSEAVEQKIENKPVKYGDPKCKKSPSGRHFFSSMEALSV